MSRTNRDGAAEEVFRLLTEPVGEMARASASLLTSLGICAARHRLTRSPLLGGGSVHQSPSFTFFFFFLFNLEYLAGASGATPPRGVRKAGRMSVGRSVGGRSVQHRRWDAWGEAATPGNRKTVGDCPLGGRRLPDA